MALFSKKVALINPPNNYILPSNVPSFLIDGNKGYLPPLGLMYLASYLRSHSEHDLLFIDALVEGLTYDEIARKVVDFGAEIVGIGVITFYLYDCIKVAESIRRMAPNITIIMGGPHVAIFPDETAQLACCDYALKGECEMTFHDLINALPDVEAVKKIGGVFFVEEDGLVFGNEDISLIGNIDALPSPDRSMIPYQKYSSILSKDKRNAGFVTTIFSSRGCPYKCIFCDRPNLGKSFRYHSPEYVVGEIEAAYKLGIREFFFYDDTFSVNKRRVIEICELIIQKKLEITWDIRTRVNDVSYDLLKVMKQAGLVRIHFGVEAGSEEMLKVLKKGITKEKARMAFRDSEKLGIQRLAYFMFGSPGETVEQMRETIDFARELNPEFCHFAVLTPFPGTPIYLEMLQKGVCRDYWRDYALNPTPDFVPPFYPESLPKQELLQILEEAYKSFYLTPKYVLKSLMRVRSLARLRQYTRIGWNMMTMKGTRAVAAQNPAAMQV